MFKNMTKVVSKSNNHAQRHSYRGGPPKTKPIVNERPIPSPRLKSFPAEKIKRIADPSPIRHNSENRNIPPSQIMNSGQGDSSSYSQNPQLPKSLGMADEKITSASEPRVSQNVCPVENHVIQSESAIPSSRMIANSAIDSHHRPHVPNVRQADTEFESNFPRKFAVNVPHESTPILQEKMTPIIEKEVFQSRDPWKIENEVTKKVGKEHEERFSEADPSKVVPSSRERTIGPGPVAAVEKSLAKDSNLVTLGQTGDEVCPNFSPQIQSMPRPNVAHYYTVDNNNNVRVSGKGQFFEPNSGMTSPQDNAMNQVKNCQRCLQLGTYVRSQDQPNGWFRHNHPRLINDFPPMRYTNVPQYYSHPTHDVAPNQHQNFQGYRHTPIQQQYYYRQIPWQPSNNDESPDKQSQLLQSGIPNQPESSAQNLDSRQQRIPERNEIPSKVPQQRANNEQLENPRSVTAKKKPLKFTSAMIRDQEVLIATMRQQGINEDIMRRHFDALLTEQRKQLLYLQQLENPEHNEKKSSRGVRVQRKISTIEEDGKPEWMLHITPPRIPYSVVEKMQAERHGNSQIMTPNDRNILHINPGKQPHDQRNETCGHDPQKCHQHPGQTNGNNNCQQLQFQYPHVLSENINAPQKENQTSDPSGVASAQHQASCHGYPALYSQQPEKSSNQLLVTPENYRSHEGLENKRQYEEPRRNTKIVEPSSLLKLRIQKDVIKRQKQNNGLQDSETIKEAMQALKNPANRTGLEYLENLNKKPAKPILLNGAQDPREIEMIKQQEYYGEQPSKKILSANGLENSRNSNNPLPPYVLRQRSNDEMYLSEYPRQRGNVYSHGYRGIAAERENGTVATTKHHQNYNSDGKPNDQTPCTNNLQQRLDCPNWGHPGYFQPGVGCNDDKCANGHTAAMPFKAPPNGHNVPETSCNDCMAPRPGYLINQIPPNNRQPEFFDPRKSNDIYEPVIIGGIKYLARKPEYSRSDISSHYHSTNHGNVFNPTLACH